MSCPTSWPSTWPPGWTRLVAKPIEAGRLFEAIDAVLAAGQDAAALSHAESLPA